MPWPGRASVSDSRAAQRLFVPAYVPVAVELASLLGEMGNPLEAEPLMERDRRLVGQRDAGVSTVQVLALHLLEELLIETSPDAVSNVVGRDVDACLDRGLVAGFASEAAGGRVADHGPVGNADHDPIPPGGAVLREPFAPLLHRHRVEVEREVGLEHVTVVDVIELAEIFFGSGAHHDFGVADLHASSLFRA